MQLTRGFLPAVLLLGLGSAMPANAAIYWSLFNIEGESAISADYVTYDTRADMLLDINRTGTFVPNSQSVGRNIVGSGSDGTTYWSLFNIEDESAISADYVTYATLTDMLLDINRTGTFVPNSQSVGRNIVGSGSDGTTYWSLFNIEDESAISADFVTYGSLLDMLLDTNRTGTFVPNSQSVGRNIIGSGATIVPLPAALWLLGSSLAGLAWTARRRRLPGAA